MFGLETSLEKIGVVMGLSYLGVMILSLLIYSPSKYSSITTLIDNNPGEVVDRPLGAVFKDFDRTEFKDMKIKWNIKSVQANYIGSSEEIELTEPTVTLYGEKKEKPTLVNSIKSRLKLEEGVLKSAFLEGEVRIVSGQGARLETSTAEYLENEARVTCPDHVTIQGQGYKVEGDSADINTETEEMLIRGNIKSVFESTAKVPTALSR